jgi:hypothetical protein
VDQKAIERRLPCCQARAASGDTERKGNGKVTERDWDTVAQTAAKL